MIKPNDIYHGDCLDIMRDIPDNSIDAVIVDLPYGTTNCPWDEVIPPEKLWDEYDRICKPTANVLSFGVEPFSSKMRNERMNLFKYDLVWIKNSPSGFQHAKNMPLRDYELISVFSYGKMGHKSLLQDKRMTYNPQGLRKTHVVKRNSKRKMGGIIGHRPSHKDTVVTEYTGYPTMTLFFDSDTSNIHPTVKPIDLMRYLILTFTNPNDVVLDNTCGVGTTCVACQIEDRQFIGIEKNDKFFNIARERIIHKQNKLNLF